LVLSITIFIILVLLSAFFSGSESAYFSISQVELGRLEERKDKTRPVKRVLVLLSKPRRLLMSILIGNTVVNVAAATVAALFINGFVQRGELESRIGILLEIVVVTIIILIFSEVTPKIVAVRKPVQFACKASFFFVWFVKMLIPVSFILEKLTTTVHSLMGVKKEAPFVNQQEFKTLFEVGEDDGVLDRNEREMISSIFEFHETMVKEVMVPRTDMVTVEKNTPIKEIMKIVKEKGHSRIPVYEEKIDNIIGILFVKDLLPYMIKNKEVVRLPDMLRKAYFVPESKMIDELLREFQRERIHMAIVVDEYGGTAGLVTMEDVIEEIVGEIRDEYDQEKPLLRKIDEYSWIVDGKIDIEDMNEALNLNIPAEEAYESMGGFIFSLLGRIPKEKEEINYKDLLLIVEKVEGQRIKKVRVVKKTKQQQE